MGKNNEGHTQKDKLLPAMPAHRVEAHKEVPFNKFQAPFGILNKYTSRSQLKRLRNIDVDHNNFQKEKPNGIIDITSSRINEAGSLHCQLSPSATTIMRTASSMKQIQPHPEIGPDGKHLKLALCLFDAAEKFSCQKYDEAEKLLSFVLLASSDHVGHPIERIAKYFAHDLMERIDQEQWKIDLQRQLLHFDLNEALMDLATTVHEHEPKFPFCQLTHFTVIQTVLDSVASAERIHFIDISVQLGSSHWIVMMDALSNRSKTNGRPIKKFKITSVRRCKDIMSRKTGELLSSSAEYMNLPFVFKRLYLEMDELKKDDFELEAGEVVIVFLESCLASLSAHPGKVEYLIRTVKTLDPSVMVLSEIEAKTSASSLTFVDRFHEAVFHCSAMFDCHEACLGRGVQFRQLVERVYFQEMIRNCFLDPEDDESFKRCLGIDFWREYLARFGIVEMDLSQASLYQVGLMLRETACWGNCTLGMNGKSMLLGWNGTPLRSVSAWKFQPD